MNSTKLSIVPFRQASLCLDCDMITAGHTHCFACGSVALLNLARTLNGEDDDTAAIPRTFSAASSLPVFAADAVAGAEARRTHRWHSLRGFASAVQRAVTVALISGVLILAAAMQARGHSQQPIRNGYTQVRR